MIHLNILPVWQNLFNFLKKKFKPKTCTFVEFRALLVKNIL